MQFNTDLYWALAKVYPNITVRKLSKMMGKSAGYWSSMLLAPVHSSSFWTLWNVKRSKPPREVLDAKS
jgi:hypothetical protein